MVLVMGDREALDDAAALGVDPIRDLTTAWQGHGVLGWSTDGQALGGRLLDRTLVVCVVRFDTTTVRSATTALETTGTARRAGRRIAEALAQPDLRLVLVAADGMRMNGSSIADGITDVLPDVDVVGVLAGDGARYERSWTIAGGAVQERHLCAVGLYGTQLEIGHGMGTGWHPLGPERVVTNSHGHLIRELDGSTPAELYRDYLGPLTDELLANASMLPMAVRDLDGLVAVRSPRRFHDDGSVAMSGDVAQGSSARLLRASAADLVYDATLAAKQAQIDETSLCLVISSSGRRRVLGERVEDELDAVIEALPPDTPVVACWAYGALATTDRGIDLVDHAIFVTTMREISPIDEPDTFPQDTMSPQEGRT